MSALPTWDGKPADGAGMQMGAAPTPDTREVQKQLHDALIEQMGERRRGPVVWSIHDRITAHEPLSKLFYDPRTPEGEKEYVGELAEFMRSNPNGRLVIALAAGDPPADALEVTP